MLQSIDDDEKVLIEGVTFDSKDCTESVKDGNLRTKRWFLTESGLYEVLFLSRKPIAKEFKKGIKALLHDLRTGTVPKPQTLEERFADGLLAAKEVIERRKDQTVLPNSD